MRKAVALALVAVYVAANLLVSPASALPDFKKAFEKRYATDSGSDEFKAAVKAAGCNVCHVKGAPNKKARNAYGMALSKIVGGHAKADWDAAKAGGDDAGKAKMDEILKKLDEAFTKVEGQKSASGQTYGDLIKAGKLPSGN
jgi:hypothetical protein